MKLRTMSLAIALALLLPLPAFAQHTRLIFATDHGIYVSATDQQLVRVTIGNPRHADPTAGPRSSDGCVVTFDRPVDPVTIEPGDFSTYTLDPREVGAVVDARSGLRHVRVAFRLTCEVSEGEPMPTPAITIEVVNARTGRVESFQAFPGFTGGVFVG